MNDGQVTLDEVFAAAAVRQASLVPETSGYLVLAIADASSRLPLLHDDRVVLLSTEGSVSLRRRGQIIAPEDAARVMRDVLARLLSVSAGTMPGLAAAAMPRVESDRGIDDLVEQLEAALIPVNRAAARRALGRLARETMRAREMDLLEFSLAPRAAATVTTTVAASATATASESRAGAATASGAAPKPAPVSVATPEPAPVSAAAPESAPVSAAASAPVQLSAEPTPTCCVTAAILAEPTPTALGMPAVAMENATPLPLAALEAPTRINVLTAPIAEPTTTDEAPSHIGVLTAVAEEQPTRIDVKTAVPSELPVSVDAQLAAEEQPTRIDVKTAVPSELLAPSEQPAPSALPASSVASRAYDELPPVLLDAHSASEGLPAVSSTAEPVADVNQGAAAGADAAAVSDSATEAHADALVDAQAASSAHADANSGTDSDADALADAHVDAHVDALAVADSDALADADADAMADAQAMVGAGAGAAAQPPPRTRADELIAQFGACDTDQTMRAAASSLRRYAGIELTPPPPTSLEPFLPAKKSTPTPAPVREIATTPPRSEPPRRATRSGLSILVALILGVLVGAGAALRLHPDWTNSPSDNPAPAPIADDRAP